MTRAEFNKHMVKLGGLRYQPTTLDGHWELVKDCPDLDRYLDAALYMALRASADFPAPNELEGYVNTARGAAKVGELPVGCSLCDFTGFQPAVVDGVSRARKCPCWGDPSAREARPAGVCDPVEVQKILVKVASMAGRKGM